MIHQCETPFCRADAVRTVDDLNLCEFCALEHEFSTYEQRDPDVVIEQHEALFDAVAQIKKEIGE